MVLPFFNKKTETPTEIAPILPQDIYEMGVLQLKDIISPSALKISPKHLNLGSKVARTLFVISYPRYLTEEWFSPIINLDRMFEVSVFVHPIDTSIALRQLQKKLAEIQSQINIKTSKGYVRDPKLDIAQQDIEHLRDQLQQAQEKIFDVGIYITVYGDNEDELDKVEQSIKTILDAKLVYVKPALFQQADGFKSVAPLGTDLLSINSKLNSSPLSSLMPFISFDLTSNKGILFGINRHNSSMVLFDRFSLENYNSVTFAKSGAGKSIRGTEPVLIKKDCRVELVPIGQLVEQTIKSQGKVSLTDDLEGTINPGFAVWSFDQNLKGAWSEVTVAARKEAPENYYRFITQSGREIITTGDHNMLVLRNGQVTSVKSHEVRSGEYIPLPRSVALVDNPTRSLDLLTLLAGQSNIYLTGAGRLIDRFDQDCPVKEINSRYDRYLYKYKQGRRIPLDYFLAWQKKAGLTLSEQDRASLAITSKNGPSRQSVDLPVTKDLATLFGYISAEGCINQEAIRISNPDPEIRQILKKVCQSLNVLYYSTPEDLIISDRPFIALVYALGGANRAGTKQVPKEIFNWPQPALAGYLRSYFEGDGGVDGHQISITSKSSQLLSEISYLLLGFGITARRHKKLVTYKKPGRRRIFWTLTISGQDNLSNFQTKIGFATKRKQLALKAITGKNDNTNTDVIPGLSRLLNELRLHFGSQLHNIPNLSALSSGNYRPSRRELSRLVKTIDQRVEKFETLKPIMQTLANLPELETLIALGENHKDLNHKLWTELGSSWAWMKKRTGQPGLVNVLKLSKVVLNQSAGREIESSIQKIHSGFLNLDVSTTVTESDWQAVWQKKLPARTSYQMIKNAADFINQTYSQISDNLPHIRGLLGMLKRLAESDLTWDPVVTIEKKPNLTDKYVYDLTVDNQVFLAGTAGMFVHNSYATKLEILRSLMFDTDVIVIDPEREYEFLAEAVGGRYFNISLTSEHHINPFDLPVPDDNESPADVLRSNVINLVGLFRIMLGGLTPEEDSIIDNAITETYALKDITPDTDFTGKPVPLLSDLELVLAGMEGGESLAQRLVKYTQGSWSGFINKPTNVDINKNFVVFSVRDMEDELKPVAMYIVIHHIWTAIRRNLKKRLLVVDEAWWMMKEEDTASFLFSLVKRGRKYYLGTATITQDVGDFLRSPYGLPIITNSSIQILLKQSPASIDLVQKTFNLTNEEKFLLLESDVGEAIFFAGLKRVALKVIASYTEDQIITSDPSQLLDIKKAKQDMTDNQS